jgi:chloramphenicol O-acetyltransferase
VESLPPDKREFFQQQDTDVKQAGQDTAVAANTVHGFESYRSAVVPWLDYLTGIVECVRGLDKD